MQWFVIEVSTKHFKVDMSFGINMRYSPSANVKRKNDDQAWDGMAVPQMLGLSQVVLQCRLSVFMLSALKEKQKPSTASHCSPAMSKFLRFETRKVLDLKKVWIQRSQSSPN